MLQSDTVVTLNEWVPLDNDYLCALSNLKPDGSIADEPWNYIKDFVAMDKNTPNRGRLTIRLAILQAFVASKGRILTYAELQDFWKHKVPDRLSKTEYSGRKINPDDIQKMAGYGASKTRAPHGFPLSIATGVNEEMAPQLTRTEEAELAAIDSESLSENERIALGKRRLTQSKFREKVVRFWGVCAVTGVNEPSYLIASHIKPWQLSTDREKLDGENGLLLAPTLDKLFDMGHISFDESGLLISSQSLSKSRDFNRLGLLPNMCLSQRMPPRMACYMKYHRENIFLPSSMPARATEIEY